MEGKEKKVLIIGGTGFLGYHAGKILLKRGYRVAALALPDINIDGWFPKQIPVKFGDIFSMGNGELVTLMSGFDMLVYAVGPDDRNTPDSPAELFFQEKLVRASARVFDAASKAGIKRAVLLGSYFSFFHRKWPQLNLDKRHPYIMARIQQSEAVIKASGTSMDTMILELPYIFGTAPEQIPLWKEVFFERLLKINPVMYPRGGSAMICVENVAEAIAGALENGEAGGRYPVGDSDIRWKEMFTIMFTAIGVRRRFIYVPYWLAALAGIFMMQRYRMNGKEPGLHLRRIFKDIISRDFFFESEHSAEILGYGTCDVRAAIAETARACYPSGYRKKTSQ